MNDNIEHKIIDLRKELQRHNHNYYVNDAATISDYEFDYFEIKFKQVQKL